MSSEAPSKLKHIIGGLVMLLLSVLQIALTQSDYASMFGLKASCFICGKAFPEPSETAIYGNFISENQTALYHHSFCEPPRTTTRRGLTLEERKSRGKWEVYNVAIFIYIGASYISLAFWTTITRNPTPETFVESYYRNCLSPLSLAYVIGNTFLLTALNALF